MQTPPPLRPERPPDWWGRNWKWFVPLACVAGLAVMGAFAVSIMAVMKSSDAYTGAVARAKAAPAVIEALGSPIEEGFFLTGNVQSTGAEAGKAELSIPIAGPKGKATVYTIAVKAAGVWHFNHLVVKVGATGERIDLSEKQPEQPR